MYIESVTMTDFRCFEKAEATFVYPGKAGLPDGALPNVTLLIGINGTGKTSVLRATALVSLSPICGQMGYYPKYLARVTNQHPNQSISKITCIRDEDTELDRHKISPVPGRDKPQSFLKIVRLLDSEFFSEYSWSGNRYASMGLIQLLDWIPDPKSRHPDDSWPFNQFVIDNSPDYFLLGYGATRRSELPENLDSQRSQRRHPRYQRVAGLFEEYITLRPLVTWHPALESKTRQKEVSYLVNSLLPDGTDFTGDYKDADAIFVQNHVRLPFSALSDGYRSYIGLVADMLYHLNYVCPKQAKLTDLSGVVLIDDIDVHLHPAWQREVVPNLATTFPKLQFIITSHSPLVAGTLHAANIRVVEGNQIREFGEKIDGLSADQILLSSYFGHTPPRSPAAVKKLKKSAARVADTKDPKAAVDFLNELAGKGNGKRKKK